MNYIRLSVIIVLVLFIVYINRTIREGFEGGCPAGEVNIENSPTCGKPGSTLRDMYRDIRNVSCKAGFTFTEGPDGFGCSRSRDANGRPVKEFGNLICPSGTEVAVSSFVSQQRDESGKAILGRSEMCFYPCPSGTVADGATCVPTGPSAPASSGATGPAPTTPASAVPAAPATPPTRTLADVTKDIDYLKSIGFNEGSENDTMKRLVAERASLGAAPPISTPPYSNSPSALANVPTPSMSCAVENFSSF